MPLENMNSRHFSAQEKAKIENSLAQLEADLASKLINLTPDERKQYGSVNERNKLVINKVKQLADTQPDLKSPDVNWTEFYADFDSREFWESVLGRIKRLFNDGTSSKMLHDYDNYKEALKEYEYAKYKNKMEAPGFAVKVKELRQFFPAGNTTRRNKNDDTEE